MVTEARDGVRQERDEEGGEREDAHTAELHQHHQHNLAGGGEVVGGVQHREAGDATGTGCREQRIDEGDSVGRHLRHQQQPRPDGDEHKEREHHQRGRTQLYLFDKCHRLDNFDEKDDKIEQMEDDDALVVELHRVADVGGVFIDGEEGEKTQRAEYQDEVKSFILEILFDIGGKDGADNETEDVEDKGDGDDYGDQCLLLGGEVAAVFVQDAGQCGQRQQKGQDIEHPLHRPLEVDEAEV